MSATTVVGYGTSPYPTVAEFTSEGRAEQFAQAILESGEFREVVIEYASGLVSRRRTVAGLWWDVEAGDVLRPCPPLPQRLSPVVPPRPRGLRP